MSGKPMELTDANFATEVETAKGLVMVDFWAAWCGPCRTIAPSIEALAEQYAGQAKVAKLDVDANPGIMQKYNVRSIPAVLYFKDGQHVDTIIGAYPKVAFEQKLQQHLAA